MLYLSLKFEQLAYITTGLEVLNDGPKFSDIACCQERGSFVCKHRQTEARKRNYRSLFRKYLQIVFFKATQPIQCKGALVK